MIFVECIDSMPGDIDTATVRRELEGLVVGRTNGTFDCDAIRCNGEMRYTVAVDERVTVFLYASAPRHQPDQYSIKKVYCESCEEAVYPNPESQNSNEVAVEALLTRDARDEPPYVIDVQVMDTSVVGEGEI